MPIPVLTPQQASEWDHSATAAGIPIRALMESAGRSAATVLAGRFPERLRLGVVVACGPGNNGGDGWVVARALHALGLPVWVTPLAGHVTELNPVEAELARQAR